MGASKIDPALWTVRRRFGVAGGPDEIALTDEGNARAFQVGAGVRRGGPAEALDALWSQSDGYLSVRGAGARIVRTELGRFDQIAWGHLRARGLIESFQDEQGDGVRLTEAGRQAVLGGIQEREHVLDRIRRSEFAAAVRRVADEMSDAVVEHGARPVAMPGVRNVRKGSRVRCWFPHYQGGEVTVRDGRVVGADLDFGGLHVRFDGQRHTQTNIPAARCLVLPRGAR